MTHLARRKPPRSGIKRNTTRIECQAHLQFVRGFECVGKAKEPDKCTGKIQAHHVISRGAGGGDDETVPMCVYHHERVHKGRASFEALHGINMKAIAEDLAKRSPAVQRLRREMER
jgi:hypothetical protein